jgi:hypothetical protein
MKRTPKAVKARLVAAIGEMACKPELFVKNPGKDFTRKRKLGFADMLTFLLGISKGTLRGELLAAKGYAVDTPSASAFIQQRDKILPIAFEFLLQEFTRSLSNMKTHNGYRLLAVDGSDLHTPTNPQEPGCFFSGTLGEKGYNLLHLNALYDLCNGIYADALIQSSRGCNEHEALTRMVDRSHITGKTIIIADRGYESYNNLAHIERKGWYYLIRIKDNPCGGILAGLNLPATGEFDSDISRILTRKQTKEVRAHPEIYRRLMQDSHFDFLDLHKDVYYPISFRIVRFKVRDELYETVITNLDRAAFSPSKLKTIYRLRWGIETAFRTLKYTLGLLFFHSKKAEYIAQEIFAKLTMYNFSQWIASSATLRPKNTRYDQRVNFSQAVQICRHFFLCRNAHPPDVEALILTNPQPVRPGRCFPRNARVKQPASFNYRIS